MTKQEFFEKITDWRTLLDFCWEYNLTTCDNIVDDETVEEDMKHAIKDALDVNASIGEICHLALEVEHAYGLGNWYNEETWECVDDEFETYLNNTFDQCINEGIVEDNETDYSQIQKEIIECINEEIEELKQYYITKPKIAWEDAFFITNIQKLDSFLKWLCSMVELTETEKRALFKLNQILKSTQRKRSQKTFLKSVLTYFFDPIESDYTKNLNNIIDGCR